MSASAIRMTGELPRSSEARLGGILPALSVPLVWGGALVLMGLGAGAVVGAGTTVAGRIGGSSVVTLGLALFLWAALSLSAGRMIAPRAGVGACLVGIGAATVLLALVPQHASIVAVGVATLLLAGGAGGTIAASRRATDAARLRVWPLIAAAAVVSVLVTPALGATQDAVLSGPDGTRIVVSEHEGH